MQQFTGTQYLQIDIANCFGHDRLNWSDRLAWFHANEHQLEALSPKADSPILYRKAVRAMRTVQAGKPTNHIMGLDATASGLQIMGAMSGCHVTANAVNLLNSGKREDVYASIADYMNQLPDVKVDRQLVKKPIMTVFYGSTAQPLSIFGETPALIAFYQALREQLTGAYELMGLFQQYWNPHAEYHQWTLPDGHVARVPVTQTVEKDLEIDEYDHMRFSYRAQIVQPKLKSRSLAANIVHSVDAFIVRQMVAAAKEQGYWMAPIHDCFYASPNHMNQIRENYLHIMQWIARSNLVSQILSEISGRNVRYTPKSSTLSQDMADAEYSLS